MISFNAKASADEAKKHEDFVTRMVDKGYTPSRCACCASGTCACARAPERAARGRQGLHAAADHRPPAGGQEQVDRQPRALPAPLQGADPRGGASARSTAAASATSSAARTSRIPKKDISEPVFGHGQGGMREIVHPGNKEYVRGDRIERPEGRRRRRRRQGQASDSGEGEDDFVFTLTKEEFMQVFFEDLALPHLVRTQLAETPEWKSHRAGYTQRRHADQPARACARCAARSAGASRIGADVARASCASSRSELDAAASGTRRPSRDEREIAELEARHRGAARAARAHPLPRPDRPALPQPRPRAGADHQGGDVLPDGRLGLDGRGAQGPRQALLHPAVPVPDAALRARSTSSSSATTRRRRRSTRRTSSTPPRPAARWCRARWC